MTLRFDIRTNSAELVKRFHNFRQDRLPEAHREAANRTGRYMHGALTSEMREVFDRPTQWALKGLRFKLATRARPEVNIWLVEDPNKGTPAADFLAAQIQGGPRRRKRFEQALIAAGRMPAGMYAVPGRQAPLDAHGNVPASFIIRVLADLQAFGERGFRPNRRGKRTGARKTNYFFVPRKGSQLKPGIYWHMPNGLLGVAFRYVSKLQYTKRYDFFGVGRRAYERKALQFLAEEIGRQAGAA